MSLSSMEWAAGPLPLALLTLQLPFTAILLSRLLSGASRQPPISAPSASASDATTGGTTGEAGSVSIIVPTLNEVHRIAPCLQGLIQQGSQVREILVVDSRSTDGTPAKVSAIAQQDSRIRLITDEPLPPQWVGRPWALHSGYLASSPKSKWILGIDADTEPQPDLVAAILAQAEQQGYDLVSLSPRFRLKSAGEWWLQPALLMTLIYRFDSAGVANSAPERVMANGQCFLCRRALLETLDGYRCAADSFCDDVSLARVAAAAGFKVGFLDGAKVISVRMYEGLKETWQGWGRSLDLKDAASAGQLWGDLALLMSVQALPLFAVLALLPVAIAGHHSPMLQLALGLNLFLWLVRWGMQGAIATSYHRADDAAGQFLSPAQCFWLSPLADPLAVLRILLSSLQTRIQWRGRTYQKSQKSTERGPAKH
ncbi:MAG: 2'-O-glycosyltransferase CruG [Phormidesmis sp.]